MSETVAGLCELNALENSVYDGNELFVSLAGFADNECPQSPIYLQYAPTSIFTKSPSFSSNCRVYRESPVVNGYTRETGKPP